MDSTQFETIKSLLDSISTNQVKASTIKDFIPLISVIIGALIAFSSQFFLYLLTKRSERKKILLDAYSDCERLKYLISEAFKELNMYKAHKKYFYRIFEIKRDIEKNNDESEKYHKRHVESNQKMLEVLNKIRAMTSDYYKNIARFKRQIGESIIITNNMNSFLNYEKERAKDFEDINDTTILFSEEAKEELRLNEIYKGYTKHLEIINDEIYSMTQRNLAPKI